MKNNQTVLEWLLSLRTGKARHTIISLCAKTYQLTLVQANDFLSSPAESIYMGEVSSLLLELRK